MSLLDDSDDELLLPSALLARFTSTTTTTSSSSKSRADRPSASLSPTAAPARSGPARTSAAAIHSAIPSGAAPVERSSTPRRSPRRPVASPPPPPTARLAQPAPTAGTTDSDDLAERARHRALADELFPPSPPRPRPHAAALSVEEQQQRRDDDEVSVISDSEIEREAERVRSEEKEKERRRARRSEVFQLSDDDDDEGEGEEKEQGELERRMKQLGLAHASPSTPSAGNPFHPPAPPFPRPSNVVSPPLCPSSHASAARRSHRRITISVASSSSSDEDDTPFPSRARAHPAKPPATPRARVASLVVEAEEEEIVAACTDDEDSLVTPGGGRARELPEDVAEVDGVFIYDPTPKKRLVKLNTPARPSAFSPVPSHTSRKAKPPAPAKTASPVKKTASGLRREIDLTGSSSSSSEDEQTPPPRSRTAPSTPRPPAPRAPRRRNPSPASSTTPRAAPSALSKPVTLTPAQRASLPLALIRELDRSVFRKRWDGLRRLVGEGEGLPDGIEVVWNKRLRNTAGRASWKRTRSSLPGSPTKSQRALVELSTHVTDTEAKLRHTLAHELCHLAAWAIDGEMKPPHGRAFKLWAQRVMLVRPDIEVTTTHSYEIQYRYRWQCASAICGKIFGRHSNSINPATHGCPCGARLVAIDRDGRAKPVPGAATPASAATPGTERKKSKWIEFMQAQSPIVRREHPALPQSEVLKLVAERWKVVKAAAAAAAGSDPATPRGSGKSTAAPTREGAGAGELDEALERLQLV